MVATPQAATFIFRGLATGKVYSKDAYVSDVANALLRWDSGVGASSTSDTFLQFREAVALVDYSMVTGTADTTKIALTADGIQIGDILRYSIHLTTLANRPKLNSVFGPISKISAIQLA